MFEWLMLKKSDDKITNEEVSSERKYTIKELDYIQFKIIIDAEHYERLGTPCLIVGDIPIPLIIQERTENAVTFTSESPLGSTESRLFYNFFGESEVLVYFSEHSTIFKKAFFDILARKENAELAIEMLDYLTKNIDDTVAICFSRSKAGYTLDGDSSFNFTKIDIIKKAIYFLTKNIPLFIKEHKYILENQLTLSERGQPIGPDSVWWALSNLDKLFPASNEDMNFLFNNRGYQLKELPQEHLAENTDVIENRVINSFLFHASQDIISLLNNYESKINSDKINIVDKNFVRFDHTLSKYAKLVLEHKCYELKNILTQVENIRSTLNKIIPSKIIKGIPPKFTSYISKHSHYKIAFKMIEQYNKAAAPTNNGSELLLGLKNLSIIYEFVCLLLIQDTLKKCFDVSISEMTYRYYNENSPFGGIKTTRPDGEPNNYFILKNKTYKAEIFYEPKIYPMNDFNIEGDFINISNNRLHPIYGQHYYSPDFILRVSSIKWKDPIVVILDSKYKDKATINKYDIDSLTMKYLLNLGQIRKNKTLGISPIKLLLILFAHDGGGAIVRRVAKRHSLIGEHPILPQATGVLLKPSQIDYFEEHLLSLFKLMDNEYN